MSMSSRTVICDDDNGLDIEAIWTFTDVVPAKTYGDPEFCHPAEGGEYVSVSAYDADGVYRKNAEKWLRGMLGDDRFENEISAAQEEMVDDCDCEF